jgi:hypothetical protein
MKISIKVSPYELCLLGGFLFLTAIYLWFALPKLSDSIRSVIVASSVLIILILESSLRNEFDLKK